MKAIIIYSGKGGVGKTTTTANLAKVLAESGKKVFVIDADVNTPSMNIVFGSEKPSENIGVASMGFNHSGMIYIEQSMVKKFIRQSIRKADKFNPDFILIDTPPSITDVHINLINSIDISGMIMVTQPNELSLSDVNRTALFFENREIGIIGVVENMGSKQLSYGWELLGSIPFVDGFNGEEVFKNNKDIYKTIAGKLDNVEDIILKSKASSIFDESITVEDIKSQNKAKSKLRFVNASTWPWVREQLLESQDENPYMLATDGHLDWATEDRVNRLVKAFEDGPQAYFMITKVPHVGIDLMCGEIGQGTLFVDHKYYGLPRVKYNTFQGEVTLFLHEVTPVGSEEISEILRTGGIISKDGRYIQGKDAQRDVYNMFGSTCGMTSNWEEKYDRIIEG